MIINIRNDRRQSIAVIEIKNGCIVKESLRGCYVSDIDSNSDNNCEYQLDIIPSQEFIEGLSNETILNEIASRMQ